MNQAARKARILPVAGGVSLALASQWCLWAQQGGLAEKPISEPVTASAKLMEAGAGNRAVELATLREALERQRQEIERLRDLLERQSGILARLEQSRSARPALLAASLRAEPAAVGALQQQPSSPGQQPAAEPQAAEVARLAKTTEDLSRLIGGFRFTGDFRYRFDMQLRSSNAVAGPLQNIRSRYRLRLNLDKELDRRFRFHLQLSTAPFSNAITNDQDMAGITAKHPFSIAEAYIDFSPNARVSLRGGRTEEIFADGMRFLWDDDVRFNGFHQTLKFPLSSHYRVEFRAAEYVLSNPNVPILSAASPYVSAGQEPGKKVRDANLFHPGFVLQGDFAPQWTHRLTSDVQLYRNPNQIQLASTPDGFPLLVSKDLGFALAGPLGGTGNATTRLGGASYYARHYQIARVAYRLERPRWMLFGHSVPAWLDLQVSRNVGTGRLRDALMISANAGAVQQGGDVRFLYQYAIKDANSILSQFTDDDLGTGTGVNIAVHALRLDVGLTRFLQWQNLLFIQNSRRASNPAAQFFVPLQRGSNPTLRYLGQLAFSF